MAPRYKNGSVSDAAISIASDSSHLHASKWVSLSTLEVALKQRYGFKDHLERTWTLMGSVLKTLIPNYECDVTRHTIDMRRRTVIINPNTNTT